MSSCKELWDCKKKTPTSPSRRERPLIMKMGWGTTERETERGREDAVLYEKEGYQPDRCRIMLKLLAKVLSSELTNTIEQLSSLYTINGMKHISPTFVYVNVPVGEMCFIPFEADNIHKKHPPHVISSCIFLLFLFRSGAPPPMTLLTAGALTDPQLPATASNVCTTDARLGGVGRVALPKQKSWLRRWQVGIGGIGGLLQFYFVVSFSRAYANLNLRVSQSGIKIIHSVTLKEILS